MIKDQSETVEHVATLTFLSRIWSGLFGFIPVKSRAAIFFSVCAYIFIYCETMGHAETGHTFYSFML